MTLRTSFLFLLCAFSFTRCGVYSLNGASIDYTQVQTISIQNIYNDTPSGPANLSQIFTEGLRDFFQQNTNLELVNNEGDLQFEGKIVGYETAPVAPQASINPDQVTISTLTSLSITVQMTYFNTSDDTYNFDRSFTFQSNFDNSVESLNDVEERLIEEISEQIILDIFNASVANW
jgi:hypothetical protein